MWLCVLNAFVLGYDLSNSKMLHLKTLNRIKRLEILRHGEKDG